MDDHVPSTDCGKDLQHKPEVVSILDHDSVVAAGHKRHSGHGMVSKVHRMEDQGTACFQTQKAVDHSMDHDTYHHKDLRKASLYMDRNSGRNMGHRKVLEKGTQGALVCNPAQAQHFCRDCSRCRSSVQAP